MRVRVVLLSCFWLVIGLTCATVLAQSTGSAGPVAPATPAPIVLPPNHTILVAFRPGSRPAYATETPHNASTNTKSAWSYETVTLTTGENVEFTTAAGGTIIQAKNRTEYIILKDPSIALSTIPTSDIVMLLVKNKKSSSYCWFERDMPFGMKEMPGPPLLYRVTDGDILLVTTIKPMQVPPDGVIQCGQ